MRRPRAAGSVLSIAVAAVASSVIATTLAASRSVPASRSASVPASASAAAHVSGRSIPRGDLPRWRQVFAEDFRNPVGIGGFPGGTYGREWGVYDDGWKDTTGRGVYMPSKVLAWYIHTAGGRHMVAAPVPRIGAHGAWGGRTYGRFAVRFRAAPLHGYKTAFMLWPDSRKWPTDGEIDFPEGDLDRTIGAYAHFADPRGGQRAFETNAHYSHWHTAVTTWTRGMIVFRLDGRVIGVSRRKVPSNPMHWVLQVETSTSGAVPRSQTAGHVRVDWVVAYARKGS